jgi:C-terminal processing protease CtpA/Prc
MHLKSLRINYHYSSVCLLLATLFVLAAGGLFPVRSQQLSSSERERDRMMLKIIKDDVKEHYYDPTFHGVNLDESFKAADEKIKQATSNSQIFAIIAQTLMALNDSHTFFLPPMRGFRVEYGWQMKAVGDLCYVTIVKPGSDAEAKGMKAGDIIQKIDGFDPTRQNLWILNYLFRALSPRSAQQLVVQSPGGQPRELVINSKVREGQKLLDLTNSAQFHDFLVQLQSEDYLNRHRFQEYGNELLIWKMPQFDLTEKEVEGIMGRVKKFKSLILDLRGNGGGYEETMRHLVGYFLGAEVKIADIKSRKDTKPLMSKKAGGYEGKLIVLVDSDSASASEIFAREMQLEKRATIIGDKSSGSVMQALHYPRALGTDSVVFYGTSITDADVIMSDGKSMEHVGVTPDELLLPTAEDMAAKRDPVLAHAADLAGVKLDPEKAGALFPVEWPR